PSIRPSALLPSASQLSSSLLLPPLGSSLFPYTTLFRSLRYLGPERFWASLHLYVDRHALGNATSDDLRQAVLDATGENLDWFWRDRKSTRLNSSHEWITYAVFCVKKKDIPGERPERLTR